MKSLPSREEYIRSSTERFAAICCLKKLGFVLAKLGRSVQAFVSQIGKFVRFFELKRTCETDFVIAGGLQGDFAFEDGDATLG